MKQSLQLKISQNLALTPQLQQSIRLLQLSTLELNQELEIILQENPLLELVEGDDDESDEERANSASIDINQDTEISELATNSDDNHIVGEVNTLGSQEASTEAPISEDDFKQSDFDEDYEEYGSASPWDEGSKQHNDADDDDHFTRQETVVTSLRNHLLEQIKLLTLSDRDQRIMLLLIDSINENGYLESSLEDIMAS
jgi:RNA polymerase sigma-54 factor